MGNQFVNFKELSGLKEKITVYNCLSKVFVKERNTKCYVVTELKKRRKQKVG